MITDFMIGPSILMYHSIVDDTDDPYAVSVNAFREQMSWLSEHGFEVVPLSFLLQSIQARNYRKLRKKVVITFDDGYKDFLANALPILLDRQAPATVFLVTDMLGRSASWNKVATNVQLMNEDEVRYIKVQGINLGSHTATHVKLTLLDHNEMQRQLKNSHDSLTQFGESFYTFSYPWGQYSSQIADALKATGFECALAVGEQTRYTADNTFFLPRITMTRDMDLKLFQSYLKRTRVEKEMRRRYGAMLRLVSHNKKANKGGIISR